MLNPMVELRVLFAQRNENEYGNNSELQKKIQ